MPRALVIGGNRFIGKSLVSELLDQNWDVSTLNRGNLRVDFRRPVTQIFCDRRDARALAKAVENLNFDVVFDQICFEHFEAMDSIQIFNGRTRRYVFASSQSVYPKSQDLKEIDFDPRDFRITRFASKEADYAMAKRQVEEAFAHHATFPYVAVRFPIVVGPRDPTDRIQFHVYRMIQNQPIYFPDLSAKISLISQELAGSSLLKIALSDFCGPINVASPQPISMLDFITLLEGIVGCNAILAETPSSEAHSPYGVDSDWYMNCDLLKAKLGIQLPEIEEWLPPIIERILSEFNSSPPPSRSRARSKNFKSDGFLNHGSGH